MRAKRKRRKPEKISRRQSRPRNRPHQLPRKRLPDRDKSGKRLRFQSERQLARAELKRRHALELARLDRTFKQREQRARHALRSFRPRRGDRGKIVFIGIRGGHLPPHTDRKGYAIYVNRKGRKSIVRQLSRTTKRLERVAVARKLSSVDVTKVRSKRAKRQFLEARLNPVAQAALQRTKRGISSRGTRYAGNITTTQFYVKADAVNVIARELVKAVNGTRGKKDFLVTIGLAIRDGEGKIHWIQVERRFSRRDKQKANLGEAVAFLGREVYAFLAKELADRNLVLSGSGRHIARLKENRGKTRDKWTKGGFIWQGHDMQNVSIERVEYRFDQLMLSK